MQRALPDAASVLVVQPFEAFGNQLSEVDLAAVITYERNAWGNNTGDMVTPKEIFDYKNQQ